MSLYEDRILPVMINLACATRPIMAARQEVVPLARGQVLEVGMGSGINLPLYDPERVEFVWGLEPSAGMRRLAAKRVAAVPFAVKWLELPGEAIPLPDESVDTVLLTFTLCTIPDARAALAQMHRVLKPDGQLLFCEHGLAPDVGVQQWQHRLNPMWKRCAGGCNINRPMVELIREAGFDIVTSHSEYGPQMPRIAGYISRGVAKKAARA